MFDDFIGTVKELLTVVFGGILLILVVCAILAGIGFGGYAIYQSTLTPAEKEARRQADIAEQTPHIYSKVDGCTVYIWRNGSYNSYFTKCDNTDKVVTEFSHGESCGKACTKKVTEKVETN
jgi:hypothetical protein